MRSSSDVAVPRSVRLVIMLVLVEAAALAAFTVWFLVNVFPVADPVATRLTMAIGAAVFQLLVAAALVMAARGLAGLHHWPRSLLLVLQVFALVVGIPLASGGLFAGWAVCVVAVATSILLLWPTTTAAIEHGSVEDGPVEDGPIEDGPIEDGPIEDGPIEDGAFEDGAIEHTEG